jgi:hypothetical protein
MTYLGNPKADPGLCQIAWPVPSRNALHGCAKVSHCAPNHIGCSVKLQVKLGATHGEV